MQSQARSAQETDLEGYRATDLQFHKLLGTLSLNLALKRMVGLPKDRSHLAMESAGRSLSQLKQGLYEHQAVLTALEARDAEQASKALLKHFKRIRGSLESWLAAGIDQSSFHKRAATFYSEH